MYNVHLVYVHMHVPVLYIYIVLLFLLVHLPRVYVLLPSREEVIYYSNL